MGYNSTKYGLAAGWFLGCFLSVFGYTATTYAQSGSPATGGARGLAMGNASASFTDINAAFSNQGGLGFLQQGSFSAFAEQRFSTGAINSFNVAAASPINKMGVFGLNINYFGFQDYNEQKIGLIYARPLSERFSLGLQLDYLSTRIPTYGQASSFTAELGFVFKMNKTVHLAAHAHNLVRSALPNGDKLPTIFKTGLAYMPSDKVRLNAELEKNINNPLNFKLGLEYKPVDNFYLRTGFNTAPFRASGGLGIVQKQLVIDIAANYHQILGFTPALSLSYNLGKTAQTAAPVAN